MENTTEKSCPFCAETIKTEAIVCKHCGRNLDSTTPITQNYYQNFTQPNQQKWSPGVAAILSLLIPGAGQMYKGDVGEGIVWLFGISIGYLLFIIPGLIAHIFCIINAASGNPYQD